MVKEWPQHVLAKPGAGVAAEADGAEGVSGLDLLPMVPGTEDHEYLVVGGVEGLDGLVDGDRAVDVFLVPEAVDEQDRNLEGLLGEDLVDGLIAPECVVGGVLENLLPEAHLLEAVAAAEFTG